jgi:glycine/D-amino acid oxidase-like deaminating enzyme
MTITMPNESSWREKLTPTTYFPSLVGHHTVDVAIIGGGMAGILTAYFLAKSGKKVFLLEKEMIGGGASGYTTAFITQSIDTDSSDMISLYGIENAKLIVDSHCSAIDTIEKIIKQEKIECEFTRCSNYIFATTEEKLKDLRKEFQAMKKIGYECELQETAGTLGFVHTGYIEVKNQAKFHPLKFLYAVADRTSRSGVKIFENTNVKDLIVLEEGSPIILTDNGEIVAKKVIVATYKPFNKTFSLFFKNAMYVTYILELEMEEGKIPVGTYEDMENPYHYFRIDRTEGKDRVILGGEDHRKDIKVNATKNFKALEEYAAEIFGAKSYTIKRRWSGPILEPVDGLPFIGSLKDEEAIFYTTAFSGNGMTYSVISAHILRDQVLDKEHPWLRVYNAKRSLSMKSLAVKGKDFTEEFFRGAVKNSLRKKSKGVSKKK